MPPQTTDSHPIAHNDVVTAVSKSIIILKGALRRSTQLDYAPDIDTVFEPDYETLRKFLIRVAKQESGISSSGLSVSQGAKITHHKTNVMQIDDIAYRQIKGGEHFILRRLRAFLKHNSITMPTSIPTDTNQNVLMAAFYIMWKINDNKNEIPSACAAQAEWWKTHYNTSSGKGTVEDFKKNNCGLDEAITISFPQKKIYEAKKLDQNLYVPLHDAIVASNFWTYENTYEEADYNKILKNDVDQTEAAEVLTSTLNNFFMQHSVPTKVAVGSPDPEINPKTIINPGHPNYPNKIVIGGNQGIAGDNNKKGSSRFLMNLHLGTFGDNFSISDIDPQVLAQNIGKLIRHELIHLYQIEARRKNQRISRLAALGNYKKEKEIASDGDSRDVYLDSKIEIDAYAHEFAEELLQDHGKEKAIAILRGDVDPASLSQSEQFHEFINDDRPSEAVRRLKRKIYGHIMRLADKEIYK